MPSPHELAIKDALHVNREILRAVASFIGTAEYPRGALLAAYRNARRALAGNIENSQAVREALGELRTSVQLSLRNAVAASADIGLASGQRNLEIYDLQPARGNDNALEQAALTAILANLDGQLVAIQAMIDARQADESLVLGDDNRVGLLSPGPVQRSASRWMATVVAGSFFFIVNQSAPEAVYLKQAIAAIDERTTDCCLRVTGQTQPVDKPFILVGTPRYADELQNPPFHDYCRTAVALVRKEEAGDELTQEIAEASKAELTAREDGSREEIHPAFATSRRV